MKDLPNPNPRSSFKMPNVQNSIHQDFWPTQSPLPKVLSDMTDINLKHYVVSSDPVFSLLNFKNIILQHNDSGILSQGYLISSKIRSE